MKYLIQPELPTAKQRQRATLWTILTLGIMLPWLVATYRQSRAEAGAIAMWTALTWWTGIGWFWMLATACMHSEKLAEAKRIAAMTPEEIAAEIAADEAAAKQLRAELAAKATVSTAKVAASTGRLAAKLASGTARFTADVATEMRAQREAERAAAAEKAQADAQTGKTDHPSIEKSAGT